MKITEAIVLEHVTLSRVFDQVELLLPRLKSSAEVGAMATILEGLLQTHAQLEVDLAFVAVAPTLRHKRSLDTLYRDHREVDERWAQVHHAATCREACQLLRGAVRASRQHFRREERHLLPAVERALGLGVLTALGEAFKKGSRANRKGAQSARSQALAGTGLGG